ncbi:spore coat protein [Rossellomorea marisflavi]|nr:spore coat protein [Rossellomorea marisflavi]KML32074.1 spore coat protein [Rossellomorea marisflavi]
MNQKLITMIERYGEEDDFFGEVSESYILKAEEELNVTFPRSYREFVRRYGSGGICGVELEGVQGHVGASVVEASKRWRRLGLPTDVIVLEDSAEFVRCMYGAEKNDNRVFSWERKGKDLQVRYPTFEEYVIDTFQEGIDNW